MKVKDLIRELKKMPQNLRVDVAMHDNSEYESAGIVFSMFHFRKSDFVDEIQWLDKENTRMFKDMPEECVILRC